MLKRLIRRLLYLSVGGITVATVIWGAYVSTQKSLQSITEAQIGSWTNNGRGLSILEERAVIRSRSSAVQIMSVELQTANVSASSGTYVTYQDKYYVLTTSHGVLGPCFTTQIVVDDTFYDCQQLVLEDPQADYILILVEEIKERNPVRIPDHVPRRQEWITELATMNTVYYTGYPNQGGPYTFDGKIVAYKEKDAIFIDSYGWAGSSGAGVFSSSGNLIGYIMALEVGETHFGRQVLENFVWVIPLFKVNWIAASALTIE
jgi:hypothetical protein